MSFFSTHYGAIKYPLQHEGGDGLRNAQIGAIHSVASHFTVSNKPGIVVMPTGPFRKLNLLFKLGLLNSNHEVSIPFPPPPFIHSFIRAESC